MSGLCRKVRIILHNLPCNSLEVKSFTSLFLVDRWTRKHDNRSLGAYVGSSIILRHAKEGKSLVSRFVDFRLVLSFSSFLFLLPFRSFSFFLSSLSFFSLFFFFILSCWYESRLKGLWKRCSWYRQTFEVCFCLRENIVSRRTAT